MISFILGTILAVVCYYMGAAQGREITMLAVNSRIHRVLLKLPWQERQAFNLALLETIKEERQKNEQ